MAAQVVFAEKRAQYLFVTVQGNNPEEASNTFARKLAYEERLKYGFDNAGIEALGGTFPVNIKESEEKVNVAGERVKVFGKVVPQERFKEASQNRESLAYHCVFRLTKGI